MLSLLKYSKVVLNMTVTMEFDTSGGKVQRTRAAFEYKSVIDDKELTKAKKNKEITKSERILKILSRK